MIHDVLFALLGVAAAWLQVEMLGRAVQRGANAAGMAGRLGVVAAVFLLAARAGHLPAAVVGWLAGFAVAGPLAWRRLP